MLLPADSRAAWSQVERLISPVEEGWAFQRDVTVSSHVETVECMPAPHPQDCVWDPRLDGSRQAAAKGRDAREATFVEANRQEMIIAEILGNVAWRESSNSVPFLMQQEKSRRQCRHRAAQSKLCLQFGPGRVPRRSRASLV